MLIIYNIEVYFQNVYHYFIFTVVYLIGLDYKTIYIDGVLTGANDLVIGQGVNILIGEKVRYILVCLN
jgi:hypothetical protein